MNQRGGYPFWFDKVPKGMSRKRYLKEEELKKKKRSKNKKISSKKNKKIKQKGGIIPCAQCAMAAVPALSAGAKMAMGAGAMGAGYFVSKSSSSSSVVSKNGKKSINRSEVYELNKNGKKTKKRFYQDGKNLVINGKKSKSRSLKSASKKYNNSVKRCLKSGFKKC